MPKITEIKKQEKAGRLNILVDGKFAVGISEKLIIDFDLYAGKEITEKELLLLKEAESVSKCLDKAYRLLSFRQRSEKEIRERLLEKFEPKTVDEAIKTLKKYNYINDVEFATAWVNSRKMGRGKRALSFELKKKGISKEITDQALSGINNDAEVCSALELVNKRKKYKGLTKEEAYQKVGGFLSRRGFAYDVIKEVLKKI